MPSQALSLEATCAAVSAPALGESVLTCLCLCVCWPVLSIDFLLGERAAQQVPGLLSHSGTPPQGPRPRGTARGLCLEASVEGGATAILGDGE